jgi:hypothetical protein
MMPWIVRNLLRGTLTFRGLNLSIPPKGQLDLDELLGRDRAETSNQVLVAFEEGYLQTVRKDDPGGPARDVAELGGVTAASVEQAVAGQLSAFQTSMREDMGQLRASLAGDVRGMLENLKVARAKLRDEKERVLVDATLSDAEIKARLASLDAEERELEKNFSEIGRKRSVSSTSGGVAEKADLLSSI